MKIIDVAAICHEANRALCASQNDFTQQHWNGAPGWQRDSAVNGVKFHMANPDASPSASHDSWLKEKLEAGWVYGPVKAPDLKQHPCCVPYEQLPPEQQAKDYLFRGIVHGLRTFIEEEPGAAE